MIKKKQQNKCVYFTVFMRLKLTTCVVYELLLKLHVYVYKLNTIQRVKRNALSCSSPSPLSCSMSKNCAIIVLPIEPNRTFYCSNGYSSDWGRVSHLFSRKFVYLFAVRWLQSRRVLSVGSEYLQRTSTGCLIQAICRICTESFWWAD